jgi:hypothetical protein
MRTAVPLTSESAGFKITLSVGSNPLTISTLAPFFLKFPVSHWSFLVRIMLVFRSCEMQEDFWTEARGDNITRRCLAAILAEQIGKDHLQRISGCSEV